MRIYLIPQADNGDDSPVTFGPTERHVMCLRHNGGALPTSVPKQFPPEGKCTSLLSMIEASDNSSAPFTSPSTPLATSPSTSRIATLLLLCAIMLFVFTLLSADSSPLTGWLRAFSEAAVVGAFADWFAVVALFRHPLGLPIPHTAIVPANQGRIAANVSDFVANNFFSESPRTAGAPTTSLALAAYLEVPAHSAALAGHACSALRILIDSPQGRSAAAPILSSFSGRLLADISAADAIATALEMALTGSSQRVAVSQIIGLLRRGIIFNRRFLEDRLIAAAPWFVPEPISRSLASRLIARLELLTTEMEQSEVHPARVTLRDNMAQLTAALRTDPHLREPLEKLKTDLSQNPAFSSYFNTLAGSLADLVREDLERKDSAIRAAVQQALATFAGLLRTSDSVQSDCDRIVRELTQELIGARRSLIKESVQQTIATWDTRTLVSKLEAQVGNDLQFIRVNGTLVGGLVGLLIHAIEVWAQ